MLAVPRGQTEAALALGLRRGPTLRLIIVPQALRVIVPPLTNQYLNLTKNSSLAVAIGYPDLFAVFAGTTLNQTGQAIEIIAITMAVYLADLARHERADELVQRPHPAGGALMRDAAAVLSSAARWSQPEPPPVASAGAVGWLRQRLFDGAVQHGADHRQRRHHRRCWSGRR